MTHGSAKPIVPGVRVHGVIAATANSTVWLGHQDALERDVAIKVLRTQSPETLRLFESERLVLGRLSQHPRIVTIYGSGTDNGHPYLILQYADGGSLREHIRSGEITKVGIRNIVRAMAEALGAIHQGGSVHGDVKSANILIDSEAGPLLSDFGLSRLERGDGPSGYTLAYVAPEVLSGELPTSASDMYSLGVVLYELLNHRLPYDPSGYSSVLGFARHAATDPLPAPPNHADGDPLQDLAQQLLKKSPRDRPTADEVVERAGYEDATVRASPVRRTKDTNRRGRRLVVAVLGSIAVGVALVAIAFQPSQGESDGIPLQVPLTVLQEDSASSIGAETTTTPGRPFDQSDAGRQPYPTDQSSAPSLPPEPWTYLSRHARDSWMATTVVGGTALDVVNLGGPTPYTPRIVERYAWISASSDRHDAGVVATYDVETGSRVFVTKKVIPSDRALVQGSTAIVPLTSGPDGEGASLGVLTWLGGEVSQLTSNSFDMIWAADGPPRSIAYLDPAPDEWSEPEITYLHEEGVATRTSVGPSEFTVWADTLFPEGGEQSDEPGPNLVLRDRDGDYSFVAEKSPTPFEGAQITRWPLGAPGPPVPWPIDPRTSGTVQDVLHLAPDGTVWLVSRERFVTRFDPATNSVTGVVAAGPCPVVDELVGCEYLDADASHGIIAHGAFWLGNPVDGSLYRIDLDSMELTDKIEVGGIPGTPAATESGVWVADLTSATLHRIDPQLRSISHSLQLPCFETGLAVDDIAPALTDCEPWLPGLDWRYRPIGAGDEVWVPWRGILYRLHETG